MIKYNVNICDSGPHKNELMVHFTKTCPHKCPFCIDKSNKGVGTVKPDVDAIIKTIDMHKDKVRNISISGGEPFIYMDDLERLVDWIKENTSCTVLVITSAPNFCYENKEQFFRIIRKIDSLQVSLQHWSDEIGDKIRGVETTFNRYDFYKELIDNYKGNLLGTINILKPYFKDKQDILDNISNYNKLGFKNIKICEMFDADGYYIDIPEMLGIKMKSPFAHGCKTEYDIRKFIPDYDGHLYIKRSCFYRTNHQKATLADMVKVATRWITDKKYFFGVIHENGDIYPYWV